MDGGKTWQQTSADFDRGQPAGIAFDPTRPGYVYVGTANTNGGKYWDGGVFVSGDGGLTWTFGVSGKVTNLALLGGTVLGVGGNYGSNASFTGVGQTELVCQ